MVIDSSAMETEISATATQKQRQEEDRQETRELFFHEDDHGKDRTDWFFIGHAILIEGFFSTKGYGRLAAITVAGIGLVSALIWFFTAWRQCTHLSLLIHAYKGRSPIFSATMGDREQRDKKWFGLRRLGRASPLFYKWLPGGFIVLWVILLMSIFPFVRSLLGTGWIAASLFNAG